MIFKCNLKNNELNACIDDFYAHDSKQAKQSKSETSLSKETRAIWFVFSVCATVQA